MTVFLELAAIDRICVGHLHLTTVESLRADRKDINYDQHPDHQFRIDEAWQPWMNNGVQFRVQLRHVEASLRSRRRYLMGDRFTSADILLTTCLVWAIEYGVGVCDNGLPYLARATSRPAYTKGAAVNAAAI